MTKPWSPPDWVPKFLVHFWINLVNLYDITIGWVYKEVNALEGKMLKLGIVGDLSLQDPERLKRCIVAAKAASDIVFQVGDLHPGYDVVKALLKNGDAIPGNHDIKWDDLLGWDRTWYRVLMFPDRSVACYVVGLDNSGDKFAPETWSLLDSVPPSNGRPLLILCHKPLSTVILSDGSESNHTMQESGDNTDAKRLMTWVKVRQSSQDVMLVHGHLHSWACQLNDYATCLLDGRGGAAGTGTGELGWTSIIVTKEGLTWRKMDL